MHSWSKFWTQKIQRSQKKKHKKQTQSATFEEPGAKTEYCTRPLYSRPRTATAKSLQSCPTLCDPRDGSPPGSPVPGILQARTLEWVAISFSNA